jgi:HSP20 family protein
VPRATDDAFDNFRREIEGAMNPWSSMLDWRFPRETEMFRPCEMEEEGTLSRTPHVDMVDKGDRYHLRMEIPGIDKDKIQLNATDDSIEISGEQLEGSESNVGLGFINLKCYQPHLMKGNSYLSKQIKRQVCSIH